MSFQFFFLDFQHILEKFFELLQNLNAIPGFYYIFTFFINGLLIFLLLLWFRFIRPEDIPVQYGGLSRPSDLNNGPPKPASEFTVKGGEKVNIQIEGIEVP